MQTFSAEAQAIRFQLTLLRAQLAPELIAHFLSDPGFTGEIQNSGRTLLDDRDLLAVLYFIQLYHRGFADAAEVQVMIRERLALRRICQDLQRTENPQIFPISDADALGERA